MFESLKVEKRIHFPEEYFLSQDKKTILGETIFKDILFLDYRDTEAGSNPREYIGLKKSNQEIIKSLLRDREEMFRFLHSGMIVSVTGLRVIDRHCISYDNCCLTNGNQTRFIILIIFLLKLFSKKRDVKSLKQKSFKEFLQKEFKGEEIIIGFMKFLKFPKVNEVYRFLMQNKKYSESFQKINLDKFLNSKIRMTVNSLDDIVDSVETLDEYAAGTLIANANNDTQNVKVDDIFGSKNRRNLEKYIFKDFLEKYKDSIEIEYRLGEITEKKNKVHILALLRAVVATGILTKDRDLFQLSNQRAPIYTLFVKLFRHTATASKTIEAISKLIPLLYSIRTKYIASLLSLQRDIFCREYTEKAIDGELDSTSIRDRIKVEKDELSDLTKRALSSLVRYNIEHIFPVVVFRIRKLIKINPNGDVVLNIGEDKEEQFFKSIVNSVYRKYIDLKLMGVMGSITDTVRRPDFFKSGEEAYEALKNVIGFQETSYINDNRYFVK